MRGDAEGDAMEATPEPAEEAVVDGAEADPPPAPAAGLATVFTDGTRLRVRSAPNAESEIVGYVYAGETYQVLGQSAHKL